MALGEHFGDGEIERLCDSLDNQALFLSTFFGGHFRLARQSISPKIFTAFRRFVKVTRRPRYYIIVAYPKRPL